MRLNFNASAEIFIVFQLTVGTVNIISVLTYNQKKRVYDFLSRPIRNIYV